MTRTWFQPRLPAVISAIVVLPFITLELINGGGDSFPFVLFGFLWLLSLAVVSPLVSLLRTTRVVGQPPHRLLPAIALMILAAVLWTSLVADQMPCFLGRPNCD